MRSSGPDLSVIVPAWNEAEGLAAAIESARAPGVEILVVDGGSTDATAAVAAGLGVRVVPAERGRGRQLAAGAAAARGEHLLFLHADARLPAGYAHLVRRTLADRAVAVGAFTLRIAAAGAGLRVVEWGARQRSRWLSLPYGDQALFVRAETYQRLGGYRPLTAMEDFDFVRRARRVGMVRTLPEPVLVSPRAWLRRGTLQFTLLNALCASAWFLGVDPRRIARWRGMGYIAPLR
jgi:rSAM/selenodomain-associated transferase 2